LLPPEDGTAEIILPAVTRAGARQLLLVHPVLLDHGRISTTPPRSPERVEIRAEREGSFQIPEPVIQRGLREVVGREFAVELVDVSDRQVVQVLEILPLAPLYIDE
jgi:hypothetical protein